MWVPSHIRIPEIKETNITAYEVTTSPFFTTINASTSFETVNVIHHKIMAEWQKSCLHLFLSNKLRSVKLYKKN